MPTPLRPTAPSPADGGLEVHRHLLRVYWEDTDAGGVVFYANYLKFFERARTEWLRRLGGSQEVLRRDEGWLFMVTDTQTRHLAPARLDDRLVLSVRLLGHSRSRLRLAQQAWRLPRPAQPGDETLEPGALDPAGPAPGPLLAEGIIGLACVASDRLRPCRMPAWLLERLPHLGGGARLDP